jgi:predicted nucleic acid-binding protein
MPVWGWILIAVIVVIAVVAVVVVARSVNTRKRTERLRERFGPEYERTVDKVGEQSAAEEELAARERKRAELDIVPLSHEARERYVVTWQHVQRAFVDNPSGAVGDADSLVTQVMRDRGYPIDDFDQQAADISVDHPKVVQSYRKAHSIYLSQQRGDVGTEDQREAFVHYRALFDTLLEPDRSLETSKDKGKPKEARA